MHLLDYPDTIAFSARGHKRALLKCAGLTALSSAEA
jgi:hypothetical protein